jgi:2-iminobutanoate/2-iminopropanoate deaminase
MTLRTITLLAALLYGCFAFAADKKPVVPPGSSTKGPFSPGIRFGDTLYVSGMVGRDPKTGQIPESFEDEVKQTLTNIEAVVKEAGYAMDNAVSVQVYLTDISLFDRMNKVYMTVFNEPRPTRTTVGVAKLVGTARIEITVTLRK